MARAPTASVQLIVCAEARYDRHPFLTLPAPIRVPSLKGRASEVPRIVDERVGDRDEVEIAEEHERGAMGGAEVDRAESVLDVHCALVRPSENARAEAAQRGLVAGQHPLDALQQSGQMS